MVRSFHTRLIPLVLLAVLAWTAPLASAQTAEDDAAAARVEEFNQLYKKAKRAYKGGDYPEAARLLLAAYELDPTPGLLANAARAYEKMEDWNAAIEVYQRQFLTTRRQSRACIIPALKSDPFRPAATGCAV